MRQHRLYQASFLFRDYGFDLEDMPFDQAGNLPRAIDPKLAWAETAPGRTRPSNSTARAKGDLLRVPGIGPLSAQRIVRPAARAPCAMSPILRQLGLRTGPMEPYILLDGRRPTYQLRLFQPATPFAAYTPAQ